ncbi:GGDEF domain-containing protein [Shewanella colwelliana]|uniref:GGDEF domain-containing protein n=1 Tax=Shewanella colwelliana TaxID=23 RepID=UPI0022B06118|nr:GGDEF domain-containing protein [Shewanella colwelliana]MCZ4335972.1 membrane-associated sensor domain-containing protein [Shewanella colwelliana]
MNIELPIFEQQLKVETQKYLFNGVQWASWLSIFLACVIIVNDVAKTAHLIVASQTILFVFPVFIVTILGLLAAKIIGEKKSNQTILITFAGILTLSWVYAVLSLLPYLDALDLETGGATLSGVESLIDILVLTFAIALFPHRGLMLTTVSLFIMIGMVVRIVELPGHLLFPLTKYLCLLVIVISAQKVLYSWFKKAILRDVEKQQLVKQFRRMALIDGLTGLSNRRHFDEILAQEIRVSERNRHPLSLILLDVDFFKRLNDKLGHQVGDDCLVALGVILSGIASRPRDLAARYGGEEFVLILPNTDTAGAETVAAKLKQALREAKIPHPDSDVSQYVTVSQGVCQWQALESSDDYLARADSYLYEAKHGGRDTYYSDAMPS